MNPGGDHAFPVLTTGRRVTMDERLCRSVRRGTPDDDRCGTAGLRGAVMASADQFRDAPGSGTSSPSRRCAPISASAAGRSTNGGRRARRPGASRCRTASLRIRRSEYQRWLAAREEAA